MRLVILGDPKTKKNSGQVVHSGDKCPACRRGTGRPFVLPSAQNKAWTKVAVEQLRVQIGRTPALIVPVNCRALFYREAKVGDANNFYAALADALEEAGVVANDRLIVSWDGSRLLKDAANPRIEILLSPVVDAEYSVQREWRPRASQEALPLPSAREDCLIT
jgi:uncharacterized protein (DUF2336 family)